MSTRYRVPDVAAALRASDARTLTVSTVVQLCRWRGPTARQRAAAALVAGGFWRRYATSTLAPRTIDDSFVYDRRT